MVAKNRVVEWVSEKRWVAGCIWKVETMSVLIDEMQICVSFWHEQQEGWNGFYNDYFVEIYILLDIMKYKKELRFKRTSIRKLWLYT